MEIDQTFYMQYRVVHIDKMLVAIFTHIRFLYNIKRAEVRL